MKRFFTWGLAGVTLLNLVALIYCLVYPPPRADFLASFFTACALAPIYFVLDAIMAAFPRANKPPDDGMYSIAGPGLEAIKDVKEHPNDWAAVAFYTCYACVILLSWIALDHFQTKR